MAASGLGTRVFSGKRDGLHEPPAGQLVVESTHSIGSVSRIDRRSIDERSHRPSVYAGAPYGPWKTCWYMSQRFVCSCQALLATAAGASSRESAAVLIGAVLSGGGVVLD